MPKNSGGSFADSLPDRRRALSASTRPGRLHATSRAFTGAATAAVMLVGTSGPVHTQSINQSFWVTNGPVRSIAHDGVSIYLGGEFDRVGPPTGAGVPIDAVGATLVPGFPKVAGHVYAVAPDGSSGVTSRMSAGWIGRGSLTSRPTCRCRTGIRARMNGSTPWP